MLIDSEVAIIVLQSLEKEIEILEKSTTFSDFPKLKQLKDKYSNLLHEEQGNQLKELLHESYVRTGR